MPESSSEIISSGVTPTCWRNRTSFSAARSKRNASFSSKSLDWLPFNDCGVAALSREISEPLKGEFRFDCLR